MAYLVYRLDVRGEVERAVENATGRDLTIDGDVGCELLAGARLARAEIRRSPTSKADARRRSSPLDEIDIGVELRPLLDRQVVVRRLVLQRPQIALEVDSEGKPNWMLTPRARRPARRRRRGQPIPASISPARNLREVRVIDGEVSFYDARRGSGWVIGDADLSTAHHGA